MPVSTDASRSMTICLTGRSTARWRSWIPFDVFWRIDHHNAMSLRIALGTTARTCLPLHYFTGCYTCPHLCVTFHPFIKLSPLVYVGMRHRLTTLSCRTSERHHHCRNYASILIMSNAYLSPALMFARITRRNAEFDQLLYCFQLCRMPTYLDFGAIFDPFSSADFSTFFDTL